MTKKYLNEFVATTGVLYTKLHQFHWFVEGSDFFTLHELFEDYYDRVTDAQDEAAERLLALGSAPFSTLKEYLDNSWIQESVYKKMTAEEMVKSVITDYEKINEKLDLAIDISDEEKDFVSNDFFIETKEAIEKDLWMLRAFIA